MKILLDTCAVLYSELAPERLGNKARQALTDTQNEILVSVITIGEIACASQKKIKLKKHWRIWVREVLEENKWNLVPIDGAIVAEAYSLPEPFHRDPMDRILVATSRLERIPLVTNDRLLSQYPHVTILW